jgi:hypothetical protein
MGAGAKLYTCMRIEEGLPNVYEEMHKYMRRPLVIYDFAPDPV